LLVLLGLLAGAYGFIQRRGVEEIHASPDAVRASPAVQQPAPDDWPCWRGTHGDGKAATSDLPLNWSATENVAWKSAVPGRGHSSPIVWRDRVFLTTADEQGQVQSLLCFRRETGEPLWNTPLHQGAFLACHPKNSHASPTPACDGQHVYVPYLAEDALWVAAVELDGRLAWKTRVGPFVSEWGYGSSPVLYRNLILVAADNKGNRLAHLTAVTSYLAALDGRTGAIVWRVGRPRLHSYGTPVVGTVAGRPQLVLGGAEKVTSYDPATGEELWSSRWPAKRSAGSIALAPDRIFASTTTFDPEIVCVRADGSGDVTDSHVLWRQRRGAADIPSPLYHDGHLYVVNDKGVALCLHADTGKIVWQERLGGAFSASPLLAGDRIYATAEDGTTYVFRAAPRYELLATNALGESVLASPIPAGGRLLLRGAGFLWCIGPKAIQAASR
jgi:outer membrane protein assembly factor BamB